MYTCVATTSEPCENGCSDIVEVKGTHKNGMTNADVKAFVMENQQLQSLPQNISFFFPNLIHLNFGNNLITHLGRTDLDPYTHLETLRISNNKIKGIYEDIFEGLPLIHIEIESNDLEYVVHNITYSSTLVYINFKNNKCINMEARSPHAIDSLKDKLLLRCSHSPRIVELEKSVDYVKNHIENHDLEYDKRISFLENTIKRLKEAIQAKL